MFTKYFTAKRRSTAKALLAKVVYSRISMHLLADVRVLADMKPGGDVATGIFEDAEADMGFCSIMYIHDAPKEATAVGSRLASWKVVDQIEGLVEEYE